jgi:hypothetical protein
MSKIDGIEREQLISRISLLARNVLAGMSNTKLDVSVVTDRMVSSGWIDAATRVGFLGSFEGNDRRVRPSNAMGVVSLLIDFLIFVDSSTR